MAGTIKQIAAKSGLSPVTVSHILNPKRTKLFREETRRRVLEVARELGYRPNAAARAMSTGRFGAVALLLSAQQGRSYLPMGLLDGIHDALADAGMHLNVSKLPDEQLTSEGVVPKILRESMADGLLINYTDHIPDRMITLIEEYSIPSVWINSKQRGDCVHPDDFAAGRDATQRLIGLGHRRIAYADYVYTPRQVKSAHYSAADRQAGYEQAMNAAGLAPRILRPKKPLPAERRLDFTCRWMAADDRPTALVGYGQHPVVAAWVLAREQGLTVGPDLSLIAIADRQVTVAGMPISSMVVDEGAVGRGATEMLLDTIDSPEQVSPPQAVRFEYRDGGTVAAVRT